MSDAMTDKEFERLAQTYGGDLLRWPQQVHRAARAFQLQNPQGTKAILDRQTTVDHALAHVPRQNSSVALETQILRSFPARRAEPKTSRGWSFPQILSDRIRPAGGAIPAWGMVLALLLASGFIGGYTGYAYALNRPGSTDIIADAFGAVDATLFVEEPST